MQERELRALAQKGEHCRRKIERGIIFWWSPPIPADGHPIGVHLCRYMFKRYLIDMI